MTFLLLHHTTVELLFHNSRNYAIISWVILQVTDDLYTGSDDVKVEMRQLKDELKQMKQEMREEHIATRNTSLEGT